MVEQTNSERYRQNMERLYGKSWRDIFRKARAKSSGGFTKEAAKAAGKKGRAKTIERYGEGFYGEVLKGYHRERKQSAKGSDTVPDGSKTPSSRAANQKSKAKSKSAKRVTTKSNPVGAEMAKTTD